MAHQRTNKNTPELEVGMRMRNQCGEKVVLQVRTEKLYLMSRWDEPGTVDDWYTLGDLKSLGYKQMKTKASLD